MEGVGQSCECATLGDFAVVGMGGDRRDERVFATLAEVAKHRGDAWWLYASRCSACGQDWMVAQEERIHDNFYLKRLAVAEMKLIEEQGTWPPDFLRFEDVIRLGPDHKQVARFFDTNDLTDTVKELMEARSDISASEISYLFVLSKREASRLMDRAARMSWKQLRPFA
ncbi:MAG: hypothetical protein RSE14_03480 [Erythrobacter sp.]|jgi:hypothetical protein|uniref:hypothetical protein n=1 Tax=Erythrobacter sp. TaxID=1042 RepID=UPI002B46472D|nr:hypothetical protein [Erythrobacter sp.]WRH71169.1 MAG: hypothetical protein RSE14_03480 [Erythrobacter sp.]